MLKHIPWLMLALLLIVGLGAWFGATEPRRIHWTSRDITITFTVRQPYAASLLFGDSRYGNGVTP